MYKRQAINYLDKNLDMYGYQYNGNGRVPYRSLVKGSGEKDVRFLKAGYSGGCDN